MTLQSTRSQLTARRGELMAELFLEDLSPQFVARPTTANLGYDLLVGFPNEKRGVNSFAVVVKATERPPGKRFQFRRQMLDRFAHSNVPGLLLVADVKQNKMYYAWLASEHLNGAHGANVSIPVIELDEATTKQLKKQFEAIDSGVAAAG